MLDETPNVRVRSFPAGGMFVRWRADVEIWTPARGPNDEDHWESYTFLRAWSWTRERAERRAVRRWREWEERERRAAELEHITPVRGNGLRD